LICKSIVVILSHSDVSFKCYTVVVTPLLILCELQNVDDSGFLRTPDRLLMLSGSHAQQSEVIETMTGACGTYNLGGSTTSS
jgi:hypothetical protein